MITAKASFMGMLIKTLPHMIDATVTGGMALETRGFLNSSLEALFGFDESRISSRFSHFAGADNPVTRVFSSLWEDLRNDLRSILASHGGETNPDITTGPLSHQVGQRGPGSTNETTLPRTFGCSTR